MQINGPSQVHGSHALQGPHYTRQAQPTAAGSKSTPVSGDHLDISAAAEAAVQATESTGVRQDLVARIRQQIDAGSYETPEKLERAVDRLLDQIG